MLLPFYIPVYQEPRLTVARGELVVLLHGIFTTGMRLARIHRRLLREGYAVLSITYPSQHDKLAIVAQEVAKRIARYRRPEHKLHIVGYSMGGLVARAYAERPDVAKPDTIVCIGTPNQGTDFVDGVLQNSFTAATFDFLSGPPGREMATKGGVTETLGPVPAGIKLGVIAGRGGWSPWPKIPGEHDGKVPVERTKVDGMTDHITLHATHILMIYNSKVIDQVVWFLQHGKFRRQ